MSVQLWTALIVGLSFAYVAALSTAAGLLLSISTAVARDLLKRTMMPILYFRFIRPSADSGWLRGISPDGIGSVGMALNFFVAFVVSRLFPIPPGEIQSLVDMIRLPDRGGGA